MFHRHEGLRADDGQTFPNRAWEDLPESYRKRVGPELPSNLYPRIGRPLPRWQLRSVEVLSNAIITAQRVTCVSWPETSL